VGLFLVRDDANWDLLVFLFGALQALVFAGAGALFGTSVQRGNLADARADAAAARVRADTARDEAHAQGKEAEKGRALAEALRAASEALLAQLPPGERRGAREDELEPLPRPPARRRWPTLSGWPTGCSHRPHEGRNPVQTVIVRIEEPPAEGGDFTVRGLSVPSPGAGEVEQAVGRIPATLPTIAGNGQQLDTPTAIHDLLVTNGDPQVSPEQVGRYLWRLLAATPVGAWWQQTVDAAPDTVRTLLDVQAAALRLLAWELLTREPDATGRSCSPASHGPAPRGRGTTPTTWWSRSACWCSWATRRTPTCGSPTSSTSSSARSARSRAAGTSSCSPSRARRACARCWRTSGRTSCT
jgi:hypothetical protein